jgi:hypothetical protein
LQTKWTVCAVGCALAIAWSPRAFAQTSSSDTALAEELYQQGKKLMSEGHHAEACPKLAESQRLAPAMGTLLTLAVCHEGEGKLASSWAEFTEVLPAARRANRQDRAQYAEQHVAALAPRLSRLKIVLAPDAQVAGLVVRLNEATVSGAALGIAAPVDGGTYTISATAPDKQDWSQPIVVKAEKDQQVVTVPVLQARPVVAETPASPPAQPIAVSESATMATAPAAGRPRWPLYLAGGATVALAAGAAVTGFIALGKGSDFKDANHDSAFSQSQRQSLRDDATSMATVSTVLTVGAVGAGAAAVYLLLTQGSSSPSTQGWRVVPMAGPGVAGLQLMGVQ